MEMRPDTDPIDSDSIATKWDDPAYDWLGDTYSSHVNPVFWKLHGWIDDCIEAWASANGISGDIDWNGTWVGGMSPYPDLHSPHGILATNAVRKSDLERSHDHMPDHDHVMNKVPEVVLLSGVRCHFYDVVSLPTED